MSGTPPPALGSVCPVYIVPTRRIILPSTRGRSGRVTAFRTQSMPEVNFHDRDGPVMTFCRHTGPSCLNKCIILNPCRSVDSHSFSLYLINSKLPFFQTSYFGIGTFRRGFSPGNRRVPVPQHLKRCSY